MAINSSISNFDQSASPKKMVQKSIIKTYFLSIALIAAAFAGIEICARVIDTSDRKPLPNDSKSLIDSLPTMTIEGRELRSQMLVQNAALFSQHPMPQSITSAYVGTSRTKLMRPLYFGLTRAVNSSGNSYNEITYGLLLQAEIARHYFPNLKKVYFEASLLLRRPNRLIMEEDHQKYFALLEALLPFRSQLSGWPEFSRTLPQKTASNDKEFSWRAHILSVRNRLRFSTLLEEKEHDNKVIRALDDPFLEYLLSNGERKSIPRFEIKIDEVKEVTADNVKVQRLREIPSWAPWDHLFEVIALWGREHHIEVVFFQPPVRSDLYSHQLEYGLSEHVADLHRIAERYQIPFIDLNKPESGFIQVHELFADEDHLETCHGSGLLLFAIEDGMRQYRELGILFPKIVLHDLQRRYDAQIERACAIALHPLN